MVSKKVLAIWFMWFVYGLQFKRDHHADV